MEVKDVVALKKQLADSITNLVIEFESETGCRVDSFDLTRGNTLAPAGLSLRIVSCDIKVVVL